MDWSNCTNMVKEVRHARFGEAMRHHASVSCDEAPQEDSGWKDIEKC